MLLATSVTAFAASKIKSAYFNDSYKLQVDGKIVNTELLTAVKEGNVNGNNYVGARALAEAMGATVDWKDNTVIVFSQDYVKPAPVTDVATKIKNKAALDWPNDYQMQVFQIEQETKAYNEIQALSKTVDYNSTILQKAIKDWPDDYQMQLFQYEQELKAYNELNS